MLLNYGLCLNYNPVFRYRQNSVLPVSAASTPSPPGDLGPSGESYGYEARHNGRVSHTPYAVGRAIFFTWVPITTDNHKLSCTLTNLIFSELRPSERCRCTVRDLSIGVRVWTLHIEFEVFLEQAAVRYSSPNPNILDR